MFNKKYDKVMNILDREIANLEQKYHEAYKCWLDDKDTSALASCHSYASRHCALIELKSKFKKELGL